MDSSPATAIWDFLNAHAATIAGSSGWVALFLDRLLLRRKIAAETETALADGLEKRVRAVVTTIDVYKEFAADAKTDAASKIRELKRRNRHLEKESADWRNKYEILLDMHPVPGLNKSEE